MSWDFSDRTIRSQKIRLWTQRLREEYEQICFLYNLKLKRPVIRIDEMQSRWGFWDSESRTIALAERLIENYDWEVVLEIFKHEIAHQIVCEIFQDEEAHGVLFKKACDRLGVSDWARKAETQNFNEVPQKEKLDLTSEEIRILERAEKLLSLASSDNEFEALLAMRKVQELYAKYNLKKIQDRASRCWSYSFIKLNKKRVERYQSVIASLLNDFFFVEVIHTSTFDSKTCQDKKALELLGDFENIKMAEYVFYFLENQLKSLWEKYKAGRKLSVASKNSFYLGVLQGFRVKLESNVTSIQDKSQVSSLSKDLLVIKNDQELQAWVKKRHPKLSRLGGGHRLHDSGAFSHGKKEGKNLIMNKPLSSSSDSSGIKLLRK